MSKINERDLKRWGDYIQAHRDHADEYGENILYRAALFGVRADGGDTGHKILCPDMPKHIWQVDAAIRRLERVTRNVMTAWYACPVKADGTLYTARDISKLMGLTLAEFNSELRKGRRLINA